MPRRWLLTILGLALTGSGCSFREPTLKSDDPALKVPAIKTAVARSDRSAEKQLVAALDHDDPAIRFYAISGLERLAGERFGYEYYHDRPGREAALKRWREWVTARQGVLAVTQPATHPTSVVEGEAGSR